MMKARHKASDSDAVAMPTDLGHLRQEGRAALDIAVVALAPPQLIDRLATAVGLLESLGELPADSPPVIAMVPKAVTRAKSSLDDWREWHRRYLEKRIPSG